MDRLGILNGSEKTMDDVGEGEWSFLRVCGTEREPVDSRFCSLMGYRQKFWRVNQEKAHLAQTRAVNTIEQMYFYIYPRDFAVRGKQYQAVTSISGKKLYFLKF